VTPLWKIVRKEVIHRMAKKWDDMSEADKKEQFDAWVAGREARKVTSQAKREATKKLVAKHQDEYNALVQELGGAVKASKRGK